MQNALRRRLLQRPAEAGGFAFAGLDRDRGLAGVGGERVAGGVAGAAVADLGQQLGGGDHARALEQREEDLPVGMRADRGGDLPLELGDLRVERPDHRDEARARAAGGRRARARRPVPVGAALSLASSSRGRLPPGVALARQERLQARLAEPARVGRAG